MNITGFDLNEMKTTELRKLAGQLGLKGMSSARGADLRAAIEPIKAQQIEDAAEAAAAEAAHKALVEAEAPVALKAKRGICADCGRKEDFRGSELCEPCREYAEDENLHSDNGHDVDADGNPTGEHSNGCRVCHPELDKRSARRVGKSRTGMVIIAKGTEVHKSLVFKRAAEAIGWTVELMQETYEAHPASGEADAMGRYYATATKGTESISLAWNGRAYDYAGSSARLAGKDRKVRNLKEALRLL